MAEAFPQWSLDVLPDDLPLLRDVQRLCRAWMAQGLALHPTPDGGLTYYPKHGLSPAQKRLVEQMAPYKPLLQTLLAAHPAIGLFQTEQYEAHVICPACFQLIPLIDGKTEAHKNRKQPCSGVAPPKENAS